MFSRVIEYAKISPCVLAERIEKAYRCMTYWRELNEDYFEITVIGQLDLDMLRDLVAEYL